MSAFNKDLHLSIDDVLHFQALGTEITSRDGAPYSGEKDTRLLFDTNVTLKSNKKEKKSTECSDRRGLEDVDYASLDLEDM